MQYIGMKRERYRTHLQAFLRGNLCIEDLGGLYNDSTNSNQS